MLGVGGSLLENEFGVPIQNENIERYVQIVKRNFNALRLTKGGQVDHSLSDAAAVTKCWNEKPHSLVI